jgi:hypothetical protein
MNESAPSPAHTESTTHRKSPFHLHIMNRKLNPLQHMPPPQHLLPQLHQIRYTVLSIPYEFLQLESNEGDCF